MKASTIIFDMDGVLIDSENESLEQLQAFLAKKSILLDRQDLYRFIGVPSPGVAKILIEEYQIPLSKDEFLTEAQQFYGDFYRDNPSLKPMDGIHRLLDHLKKKGATIGLASATTSRDVLEALNRFSLLSYFDVIVCRDHVRNTKPDPECYLLAAKILGNTPDEIIVVEDSFHGIQAAKSAGMYTIGYTGSGLPADVSQADCVLQSHDHLIDFFG